jgi:hypothetical protein
MTPPRQRNDQSRCVVTYAARRAANR